MPAEDLIQSQTFILHPVLQPYISAYLYTSLQTNLTSVNVDIFPVGYGVMSFALDNTRINNNQSIITSRFNITGQLTKHHHICISNSFSFVYVLFKPFGVYRLLGLPQYLITNDSPSVLDFMDKSAAELYNKMVDHVQQPAKLVALLEQWLLQLWQENTQLYKVDSIEYACSKIISYKGLLPLHKICREVGMSESTIERQFKEKIGTSPKLYSRIVRFNHAYQTILKGNYAKWNDVVYNHQYFDQAHFIKEFKMFYGYTPSQLHASIFNLSDHVSHL